MRRHVHLITPGDHFSPLTGSAIPTVVHGLASAAPTQERDGVLIARGTFADRYESAAALEYEPVPTSSAYRYLDPLAARLGLPRYGARRSYTAALAAQESWSPSVVLLHNAPQAVPSVSARHRRVLYAHNQLLRTYGRQEASRTLGPVDTIVCVSHYLAEQTAGYLPRTLARRISVVPNGVSAADFDVPRRPDEDGRLRVAFLGRVIPDKGAHVLIDAVGRIGRADISLTIIGRPGFARDAPLTEYERGLRRASREFRSAVRFASFLTRKELPAVLSATDVLVVPSLWPEPFGLTALEGMAAGAAVVASDVGGLPEAMGGAGILVAPGDAGALAEVLEGLANDEGRLSRLQAVGRERAAEMSWEYARAQLAEALGVARDRSADG